MTAARLMAFILAGSIGIVATISLFRQDGLLPGDIQWAVIVLACAIILLAVGGMGQ